MTMNPTNPTTNALVAMLLALGTGALVGGPELGAQSFACAAFAALNIAVYRFLVERTTADLASGGDGGLSGSLLAGKLIATLAVVVVLLQLVQPVALVLGMAWVLGVTALSGTVHSLRTEASA